MSKDPSTQTRMPSSTLIPFLGGLGSLINPFKQKRGTLFKPWLLGSLAKSLAARSLKEVQTLKKEADNGHQGVL